MEKIQESETGDEQEAETKDETHMQKTTNMTKRVLTNNY